MWGIVGNLLYLQNNPQNAPLYKVKNNVNPLKKEHTKTNISGL